PESGRITQSYVSALFFHWKQTSVHVYFIAVSTRNRRHFAPSRPWRVMHRCTPLRLYTGGPPEINRPRVRCQRHLEGNHHAKVSTPHDRRLADGLHCTGTGRDRDRAGCAEHEFAGRHTSADATAESAESAGPANVR